MVFVRPKLSDLLLAAAYFVTAAIMLATARFDGGVSFLWIGSALLIPALATRPPREWAVPLLLCGIASIVATGLFGLGWTAAIPFAIINLAEACIGAALMVRRRAAHNALGSLGWLLHFVVSVGLVAPFVTSLAAGAVLAALGRPFGPNAVHFFIGHALGNMTFIPVASLVFTGELTQIVRSFRRRQVVEAAVVLTLVAATTAVSFASEGLPLLFLPCCPLVLAVFRGHQVGTAISIVLLALIGGALTISGHGPIQMIDASVGVRVQFFQFYLAAVVLTVLPVAADLRNRSRLYREMRMSGERYRMLADHSSDILLHLDLNGRVKYVSPSIRQLGGYEPDELIGEIPTALIFPDDVGLVRDEHVAAIAAKGETRRFDYRAVTRDGQVRWFETHTKAIIDREGDVDGVLSVIRDISARKAVEAKLTQVALTDSLTGLPNRRAFWNAASARTAAPGDGRTTCVAVLDIDHFKRVNDLHGHDGGDSVLARFGLVAQRFVRSGDMVARMGGEEFALLLIDTTLAEAFATCERLRSEVTAMGVPTRTGVARITISGGVALLDERGIDDALKRADEALYAAKSQGRDRLLSAA